MNKLQKKPKIEILIIKEFDNINDIRLHSIIFDKKKSHFEIEFLIQGELENKEEVVAFCDKLFLAPCEITFTKAYYDNEFLERKLTKYFLSEKAIIGRKITADDYQLNSLPNGDIELTFLGEKNLCGYIESSVQNDLQKYLHRCFMKNFVISAKVTKESEPIVFDDAPIEMRSIKVKNRLPYIGKPEGDVPGFICDVEGQYENAILAGKISNLTMKTKKKREDKPEDTKKRKRNENYFTFTLSDPSGEIDCIIFPSISNNNAASKLQDAEVILSGKIKYNYSGDLTMQAKTVTLCEIITKTPPSNKYLRKEPLKYNAIEPENYVSFAQNSLFEKKVNIDVSKLINKTIVCFDLETTGLSFVKDKIVEIGAVKIVDGIIVDKFSTLINPGIEMTEENMAIHGIRNEDVRDCPRIEEVLLDFFKYSYNAILCGHNIKGFDMKFLHEAARKLGFDFFNEEIDTVELSRRYVRGVKNHKLGTLCSHFGIINEQAHRAYEDAAATAKVLIKILAEYPEIKV